MRKQLQKQRVADLIKNFEQVEDRVEFGDENYSLSKRFGSLKAGVSQTTENQNNMQINKSSNSSKSNRNRHSNTLPKTLKKNFDNFDTIDNLIGTDFNNNKTNFSKDYLNTRKIAQNDTLNRNKKDNRRGFGGYGNNPQQPEQTDIYQKPSKLPNKIYKKPYPDLNGHKTKNSDQDEKQKPIYHRARSTIEKSKQNNDDSFPKFDRIHSADAIGIKNKSKISKKPKILPENNNQITHKKQISDPVESKFRKGTADSEKFSSQHSSKRENLAASPLYEDKRPMTANEKESKPKKSDHYQPVSRNKPISPKSITTELADCAASLPYPDNFSFGTSIETSDNIGGNNLTMTRSKGLKSDCSFESEDESKEWIKSYSHRGRTFVKSVRAPILKGKKEEDSDGMNDESFFTPKNDLKSASESYYTTNKSNVKQTTSSRYHTPSPTESLNSQKNYNYNTPSNENTLQNNSRYKQETEKSTQDIYDTVQPGTRPVNQQHDTIIFTDTNTTTTENCNNPDNIEIEDITATMPYLGKLYEMSGIEPDAEYSDSETYHKPTKLKFSNDPILVQLTYAVEDYERRGDGIDPLAATAQYELEKRIEKMDTFCVEVVKNETEPLGIVTIGMGVGADAGMEKLGIFIKIIQVNTPVWHTKAFKVGDMIVEIDGTSLVGVTQSFATQTLHDTRQKVSFLIAREKPGNVSEIQDLIKQSLEMDALEDNRTPTTSNFKRNPLSNMNSNISNNSMDINKPSSIEDDSDFSEAQERSRQTHSENKQTESKLMIDVAVKQEAEKLIALHEAELKLKNDRIKELEKRVVFEKSFSKKVQVELEMKLSLLNVTRKRVLELEQLNTELARQLSRHGYQPVSSVTSNSGQYNESPSYIPAKNFDSSGDKYKSYDKTDYHDRINKLTQENVYEVPSPTKHTGRDPEYYNISNMSEKFSSSPNTFESQNQNNNNNTCLNLKTDDEPKLTETNSSLKRRRRRARNVGNNCCSYVENVVDTINPNINENNPPK